MGWVQTLDLTLIMCQWPCPVSNVCFPQFVYPYNKGHTEAFIGCYRWNNLLQAHTCMGHSSLLHRLSSSKLQSREHKGRAPCHPRRASAEGLSLALFLFTNGPIKLKPTSSLFPPPSICVSPLSNLNAELGLLTDFHQQFHTHSPSSVFPLPFPSPWPSLFLPSSPLLSFLSPFIFPLSQPPFTAPPFLPGAPTFPFPVSRLIKASLCFNKGKTLLKKIKKKIHIAAKRVTFSSHYRILGLEVPLEVK